MDQTPISMRPATASDLEDIQLCARSAYTKYIERIGREPAPMVADFEKQIARDQVYVAVSNSRIVGYVVCYQEGNHLHLENVAVAPFYAGYGFGKKLIEFAEKLATDKNLTAVELYTNEAMTENLAMYPRLGYIETERKQQAGFSRVYFRKNLY